MDIRFYRCGVHFFIRHSVGSRIRYVLAALCAFDLYVIDIEAANMEFIFFSLRSRDYFIYEWICTHTPNL